MTVEEAINTAIEYEIKVRDAYVDAARRAKDEVGQKVFQTLAKEEIHHVEYLKEKLEELQRTGKVTTEGLRTSIPPKERIAEAASILKTKLEGEDRGQEMEMLRKALALETETSGFYRRMVSDLPGDARPLFARFLEVEEGHLAIVQAEIDYMSGTGFWFDMQEFDLEKG